MSSAAAHLCCTHPQTRTDSPSPPPRPLHSIDAIFATAALPEDHPHALRVPHKKPDFDASIVRSPGLSSKLKLQFQRKKSRVAMAKEENYDADAHLLSSQEVVGELTRMGPEGEGEEVVVVEPVRFGSVTPDSSETRAGVRASLMGSLEYLTPLIQQLSNTTTTSGPRDIVELASTVAAYQARSPSIAGNDRPPPLLPKSFSAPLFPRDERLPSLAPRRSRSDSDLAESFLIQHQDQEHSASLCTFRGSTIPQTAILSRSTIPRLHIREPTNEDVLSFTTGSDQALHLHNMGISQQLRCLSQLSSVTEADSHHSPTPAHWRFHHRERSDLGHTSTTSRRLRQLSSSGIDSTNVPSCWGRVRSPLPDTASSIYSRPTSTGASHYRAESPSAEPPVPSVDFAALSPNWPLKPSTTIKEECEEVGAVSERSAESKVRNKPLPPTPNDEEVDPGIVASKPADKAEVVSVRWLSPTGNAGSILSKDTSSIRTSTSKQGKFSERFSPPMKLIRKRRSIFRFLRPGSRKQQVRSASTPILCAKATGEIKSMDGQSDDPALLTVQYELEEGRATRSLSMSNLTAGASSQLFVPEGLQRRPTLADYERNLSSVGDDRRRPSAINIHRAKEVLEDDHRDSVGLRARLSRARPLKDDASPLMAQALEKHQQEKAMFRSASKQRESIKSAHTAPVFKSSPFSSIMHTPNSRSEYLDPHDKRYAGETSRRSISSSHLLPPGPSEAMSGRRTSTAATPLSGSFDTKSGSSTVPLPKKRIGTSLESWSRYPSHTRAERCGSARRQDDIITRDFAVDINHADIHEADETEAASPQGKQTGRSKRAKASLPKSRSMTFSSVLRYYSNLFTASGFQGQNRRTSVTTGGRLEYPELEMLPPQLAAPPAQSHHKHSGALNRFKELAREDVDKIKEYVKEEEEKVEDYVREEETAIEDFVKREEGLLEGFVKKEETKLKEYVRTEEEKFKHHRPWYHHSNEHGSSGGESPFKEISLFEVPRSHSRESSRRRSTMIGPMESDEAEQQIVASDGSTDVGLTHDGTSRADTDVKPSSGSKADLWSDMYRECLVRQTSGKSTSRFGRTEDEPATMPPSTLKPLKARSPEQRKEMDAKAIIRRFPSVTVVDDCKGHCRSISLISVKTTRSAGFERSSTNDLLELIKLREKEEREKLLRSIESKDTVGAALAY